MCSDMFADGFRWSGIVAAVLQMVSHPLYIVTFLFVTNYRFSDDRCNSRRVIVFMVKDAVVGIRRL